MYVKYDARKSEEGEQRRECVIPLLQSGASHEWSCFLAVQSLMHSRTQLGSFERAFLFRHALPAFRQSLFFPLPQPMQLDDPLTLTRSQFPTNISHLTQTLPPGCYLCCCQYVIDTNKVTLCSSRLLSLRRVNQKLLMDPSRHRYRSLGGEGQRKEQISLIGILGLICVRLSRSAD